MNQPIQPPPPPPPPPHHQHEEIDETTSNILYGDILARILSYLEWRQVVTCRAVCRPWRDAVAVTPVVELLVDTLSMANRLFLPVASEEERAAEAQLLPQLQSLVLLEQQQQQQDSQHRSQDESATTTTSAPVAITDEHIAGALRCFPHLQQLTCRETTSLRRAMTDTILQQSSLSSASPSSSYSPLRVLNLHNCHNLSWHLSDLVTALPNLRDLRCINNRQCQGSLRDLQPLRHSLTVLDISGCTTVTGHFLDLADSTILRWLGITRTAVRGDVREIKPGHYPALQAMGLDSVGIYGASEIHRVAHAADVMRARHQIRCQSAEEIPIYPFLVHLSVTSPDYHERIEQRLYTSERDPPFQIEQVVVGGRWGWRWSNFLGGCCAIHWLDPAPDIHKDDKDDDTERYATYEKEWADLQAECAQSIFLDFYDPPTPAEYEQLCREK
eukprot:scaffold16636_cov237-Amphora_coffeaeformis.AAC.5